MYRIPDNISAFIFDMDGVIFDSERAVYNEWKSISRKYGFKNLDEPYMKCIGVNAGASRQIFLDYYGEDFPYDKYEEERSRHFQETYSCGRMPLKSGIRELLAELRKKEVRIAIASSTRFSLVESEIRDAGLSCFFDLIVGGDMVERSKPAPDIFLKAAQMMHTIPSDCCVIEDSYNGIRAASAAGMYTVMIPDLLLPDDEICKTASIIMSSAMDFKELITLR